MSKPKVQPQPSSARQWGEPAAAGDVRQSAIARRPADRGSGVAKQGQTNLRAAPSDSVPARACDRSSTGSGLVPIRFLNRIMVALDGKPASEIVDLAECRAVSRAPAPPPGALRQRDLPNANGRLDSAFSRGAA
jgi:hypothetical protein